MSKNLLALISLVVLLAIIGLWLLIDKTISISSELTIALIAIFSSVLTVSISGLIGIYNRSVENEIRFKGEISKQALDLAKIDLELRKKMQPEILAPAKVYRTFYEAIFAKVKYNKWTDGVEKSGLLNVIKCDSNDGSSEQ